MTDDDHHDPMRRLEVAAERVIDRTTYEQGNRRGLLWVHAIIGLLAGVQMALWGSASIIETAVGTWTRPMMAALGMIGGATLAFGLSRRPRLIAAEVVGLGLIGLWDLLMTIGLAIARIRQDDYALIPLGKPLEVGYVVAYPTTIYAGLFALIVIHLTTLLRLRNRGLKR